MDNVVYSFNQRAFIRVDVIDVTHKRVGLNGVWIHVWYGWVGSVQVWIIEE